MLYSKKIIQFVIQLKQSIKALLSSEVGLKVSGNRFYDKCKMFSYPLKVVIYNNKNCLGYFDSDFYELGFHESLMHTQNKQLQDLIRHELAHYLAFIEFGNRIQSHGPEFKRVCEELGWGKEVFSATFCLENNECQTVFNKNSIFRKIQKLMALSSSSNPYESELAMIKSQQLLLKHHIESTYLEGDDEEKMILKRIMKQKKENAKMRAIARILETFFVSAVYSRGGEFIYLEILGEAVNVEIGEYVADFLTVELEALWKRAQFHAGLKGVTAKNSFFLGIAKGYCNKIQAFKREYNDAAINALMVIEKKLMTAREMAYQRLSKRKSYANHCEESGRLGEQAGRKLSINPAIGSSHSPCALIS